MLRDLATQVMIHVCDCFLWVTGFEFSLYVYAFENFLYKAIITF